MTGKTVHHTERHYDSKDGPSHYATLSQVRRSTTPRDTMTGIPVYKITTPGDTMAGRQAIPSTFSVLTQPVNLQKAF